MFEIRNRGNLWKVVLISVELASVGPSINDVTHLGGEGSDICDDVWQRGEGGLRNVTSHLKKKLQQIKALTMLFIKVAVGL